MSPDLEPGTVVAGIDVGNSTTEIVLGRVRADGVEPILAERCATAGPKGGPDSLAAAVALLTAMEQTAGAPVDVAVVADLAPAPVVEASWPRRRPDAGLPMRLLDVADGATGAGAGAFSGTYRTLDQLVDQQAVDGARGAEPVVVGVPGHWDFRLAAQALRDAAAAGVPVVGVLVARDEAVLIGNRAQVDCPMIDTVDLGQCHEGDRIAAEAATHGGAIRRLADPVYLCHALGLSPDLIPRLPALLSALANRSVAVVVRAESNAGELDDIGQVTWHHNGKTGRLALPAPAEVIARSVPPGAITLLEARPGTSLAAAIAHCPGGVTDLVTLDIEGAQAVPLAMLAGDGAVEDVHLELQAALGRPVIAGGSEALAAYLGARDTPGLPEDVVVVDIGGGTLDVVSASEDIVVAGAGDLITAGLAVALDVPNASAEAAKFFPTVRVETPHLAAREDGVRVFLDAPAAGTAIGQLSLLKPDGELVAVGARRAPEEWQRVRMGIKATVLERGLTRAAWMLNTPLRDDHLILLAGGGAEDQELVSSAARFARLGQIATANVAGRFGPRYAVAWGLILRAAQPCSPHRLERK